MGIVKAMLANGAIIRNLITIFPPILGRMSRASWLPLTEAVSRFVTIAALRMPGNVLTDIIKPAEARQLALQVLEFIARDEGRFDDFIAATGAGSSSAQANGATAGFLLSVLDYTLKDEALLMTLQQEQHIRPASVMVGSVYLTAGNMAGASDQKSEICQAFSHWPLFY
jgi:hypothetical protein